MGRRQRRIVGLILWQHPHGQFVQRTVDRLRFIDAKVFRQALGGFPCHAGGAVHRTVTKGDLIDGVAGGHERLQMDINKISVLC